MSDQLKLEIADLLRQRDEWVAKAKAAVTSNGGISAKAYGMVEAAETCDRLAKNRIALLYEGYTALPFFDRDEEEYTRAA